MNNQSSEETENTYMLVHPNVLRLDKSKTQHTHYKFSKLYT